MNFSISLLGVFFLILHDICLASVLVTYTDPKEIKAVYAERKSNDRHLGHLTTLSSEERLTACRFHKPGVYLDNEESKPHMYSLDIPESVIPKKEKVKAEGSGSPKASAKDKGPMDVDPKVEQLKMEQLKLKEVEHEKPESKKEEEKKEPEVIYDQEIGFRCSTGNSDDDFILSYGFGQEMFFVSKPVGVLDEKKKFSGREIDLLGYMYSPPILADNGGEVLHQKYYDLRERTEKARSESPALLDDIEKNDDILALSFEEKNILCASLMDTDHYKKQELEFVAAEDSTQYDYVKFPVDFPYDKMTRTFPTDFMKCKAKKGDSTITIGVTRSYAEGGDVFTSKLDEKLENQKIDVEVVKIPVLYNRKYGGDRKGVLEVLKAIRAK